MSERPIRDLVNEATEGLIEIRTGFEAWEVSNKLIPDLSREALKFALGDVERKKLKTVNKLLQNDSIGVAVAGTEYHAGEVPNIRLDKYREEGLDEAYTLRFVVNPTVAYTLGSPDDRGGAVLEMKQLMLNAHESWSDLKRRGVFKPVRETW